MIGKIETSQDIVQETERLEAEAEMHRQHVKDNLGSIQEDMKVSNLAKDVVHSPITQEALKYAAGVGSFLLINALIPRRSSWLLRLTLPFVANHYLLKFVDNNYGQWSEQLTQKIDQTQVEKKLNIASL